MFRNCHFHRTYLACSFHQYNVFTFTATEYSSVWRYLILCSWALPHGHLGYFWALLLLPLSYHNNVLSHLGAPVWVCHMLSKFLDRQGPGHRAGTFVNVIKAASLPSKGTELIVASHQPHKGLPLPTAMLR